MIWVYIGEVFPTAVRSKGQGVGNASHWIMNTIIALCFPVVASAHGSQRAVCLLCGDDRGAVPVVLFTYPETKGQTLEALQRRLVAAD